MEIPLLDLKAQLETIQTEIDAAIRRVVQSGQYILGPEVEQFENQAAAYLGIKHAIAVASGTDALLLSLRALGISRGDEVITTPFSFFATAGAISNAGATPVFVDIDPRTFTINPKLIEDQLTKKTKAIMPVHLYGQCADMTALNAIASRHKLPVIEDAAQAFGARHYGTQAGTLGTIGCFSFFPTKNLGGMGDAGMIATNSDELAGRIRMLHVHGESKKYTHEVIGTNSRLDALQAAVLSVKLNYLERWNEARRRKAAHYNEAFSATAAIVTPLEAQNNVHIYNQYTLRVPRREALRSFLNDHEIGHALYYPVPLHLQACFKDLDYMVGDFPESEAVAKECLSIPIYPELTSAQQRCIIENIEQFYIASTIQDR